MAIKINTTYSGRTDNTDPNYPYGKGRNVVGGVAGTGTPFEAQWYNNLEGFLQGLLLEAGITPDGQVDNANSSQLVEAVKGISREGLVGKIFQSPTDGALTEIQTRTANAGEVYEVRKTSDDSLATVYSDAAGTTEIVQNGTNNASDSAGVVEFYIADGAYYVEVGGVKSNFMAGLNDSEVISISTLASRAVFGSVPDMISGEFEGVTNYWSEILDGFDVDNNFFVVESNSYHGDYSSTVATLTGGSKYRVITKTKAIDDGLTDSDLYLSLLDSFSAGYAYFELADGNHVAVLQVATTIKPEQVGAYANDGLNDDYPAFAACVELKKPIELTGDKTYSTSQEVFINNYIGVDGKQANIIFCNGIATLKPFGNSESFNGDSLINIRGGSGRANLRKIEGISFEGFADRSINLVELNGACFVYGYRCSFEDYASAVLFHNESSGSFTEGCIMHDSFFKNGNIPCEYRRGSGNDSFHGSGLVNCWVNQATSNPAIKVGDGCYPYNAPLEIITFANDGTGAVINCTGNSDTRPPVFKGFISHEGTMPVLSDGDRDVILVGGYSGLGTVDFGRLRLAYAAHATGPDGGNLNISANLVPMRKGGNMDASETISICDRDSTSVVHYRSGTSDLYFTVSCKTDFIGGTFIDSFSVHEGSEDLIFSYLTVDSIGIKFTAPSTGKILLVQQSDSISYASVPSTAMEYQL